MKKSKIAKIVSILFILLLIGGCICLFFLPNLYDFFKTPNVTLFDNHSIYYKGAFCLCYLLCLMILLELTILFHTIYYSDPFQIKIESSLKRISILFMVLSIIVIMKTIFIPTLLSFVVALICFIASLSFYVLKEVIKAAITYKKELDYTI